MTRRSKVYKWLGVVLLVLGALWNLVGMLYGTVPAGSALGWVTIFIGIFYLWRSHRARLREELSAHSRRDSSSR